MSNSGDSSMQHYINKTDEEELENSVGGETVDVDELSETASKVKNSISKDPFILMF